MAALGAGDGAADSSQRRPGRRRHLRERRLGGSILGRHMTFVPRIDLAEAVVRRVKVHAMMDLSDGLAQDLPRLCRAFRCGSDGRAGAAADS